MKNFRFQQITPGTAEYEQMVDLRMKVLLEPIGIPRSYIQPKQEAADLLIGAYNAGQLIGCCILTRRSDTEVQLRQMAVDLPAQNQGTGRAILSYAEELARKNSYQVLLLHARDQVIPFYQKCGYQIFGEPFVEVDIGHHKMRKRLAP